MRLSVVVGWLLIAFCVGAVSDSQSLAQSPNKRRPPRQGREASPSSPPASAIKTEYDRFKDRTSVSLGPIELRSSGPGRLEMTLLFNHDGQVLSLPKDEVAMFFTSTAAERVFSSNHLLLALLDGRRERFGQLKYDVNVVGRNYVEEMFMIISRDTLLSIADSKKAEFQLGDVEFNLSDNHLTLLRNLADMMIATPTGNRPLLEVISLEVKPDPHVPGNTEISGAVVNVSSGLLDSIEAQIKCQLADGRIHDAYILEIGRELQNEITLQPQQCASFRGHLSGESTSCTLIFKKGLSTVIPSIKNLRQKTEAERNTCIGLK